MFFFSKVLVSLIFCPSVWMNGVTIMIQLLKCGRRFRISLERVVRRADTAWVMPLVQASCQIDVWKRSEIRETT